MITRKALPRRTFLRGMGTAIALPFLDSMVPAFATAAQGKPPLRMVFVYVPNGIDMRNWNGRGYFTTTGKRLSNEWFAALEGASEVNKNRGYQNIPHARPGPHVRAHQSFRATVAPGPRSGRLRAVTRFIYASS